MQIPEGFPSIIFPEGNEYTPQRWALGKRLFYDAILSKQNTVSCASCHIAQNAFSDTIALSKGDNNVLGKSNAPTLTNIGYNPYYTRAGGVPTLEMQILVPIQEHDEFNTNILDIVERLKNIPSYVEQSIAAYGREPDAFVITRSIANFERSLISGNSTYDQFQFQGKVNALNAKEKKGKELFFSSKTNCSKCHSGFNFTNYGFENNGIPPNNWDSGRMRLTKNETDRDKFKVPTLRNIFLTAPYMHDGRFKTLEEVVDNYNNGGTPHKNKSIFIKPLGLSNNEQQELIAFLKALTDNTFINNQNFKK
jgi:cytochrome c peroxidase